MSDMNKTVGIHQPYLFPYIGYFQLINAVDLFVLADDFQYVKGRWINRNYILLQEQPYLFTVPLKKASQNKNINSIEMRIDNIWVDRFLMTLKQAYGKAPCFGMVFPVLEEIMKSDKTYISELIHYSITALNRYLEITTPLKLSSENYQTDDKKREWKIFEICGKENADRYINLIGGVELYDKAFFKENGLELQFLKPELKAYDQFDKEFIDRLSIIDVIMFNTPEQVHELLECYELC